MGKIKEFVIRLVMKQAGAEKVLGFLNGKKTYVAGGGLLLAGLSLILIDLAPVIATQDPAALYTFVVGLPAHPGAAKFLEGLGLLGIKHALSKASDPQPSLPLAS